MKKIAMLNCLRANDVCAGCACMNAFYEKRATFARYADEELRLTAFMRCSHCLRDGGDVMQDEGFVEKLERLIQEGTQAVHFGVCCGKSDESRCPAAKQMAEAFAARGVEVVWGTH